MSRSLPQPTIAYLVKTFPKLSETFILQEILALEEQGMHLHLYALQPPQEDITHAVTARVQAPVTYLPPLATSALRRLLFAHTRLLLRHPWRYATTLHFMWRRPEEPRWSDFFQAGYLAWRLETQRIRHLHVHFANQPAGVAELAHAFSGISYSITAHAKDIYLSPPDILARKMHSARFVVTCTEYNRKFLDDIGSHGTPIHRIYHGIDPQRFCPPAGQPRTGDPCPIILSVGRLREKKGFLTLLHACHLLSRQGYRLRCEIVGYGPQQAELEQRITALRLHDTVFLIGRLTQEALLDRYRQATLFVLPCQVMDDGDRDGIPNVLMEAMAMQLPVVSTPVSGIPELIEHQRSGLLVPPQNPQALAEALRWLLEQPHWRQALGQAGRTRVCQAFATQANIVQLHALLGAA